MIVGMTVRPTRRNVSVSAKSVRPTKLNEWVAAKSVRPTKPNEWLLPTNQDRPTKLSDKQGRPTRPIDNRVHPTSLSDKPVHPTRRSTDKPVRPTRGLLQRQNRSRRRRRRRTARSPVSPRRGTRPPQKCKQVYASSFSYTPQRATCPAGALFREPMTFCDRDRDSTSVPMSDNECFAGRSRTISCLNSPRVFQQIAHRSFVRLTNFRLTEEPIPQPAYRARHQAAVSARIGYS